MLKLKSLSEGIIKEYVKEVKKHLKSKDVFKNQIENLDLINTIDCLIIDNDIRETAKNSQYYERFKNIYKEFNWTIFRASKGRKNVFKKIIEELGLKVCPYCGRNHIDSIEVEVKKENGKNEKKIVIPNLDHFWAKGAKTYKEKNKNSNENENSENPNKYEQYALSIYNLIPACYLCNSQFKHDKDVEDSIFRILYPYKEGFEDNIKFNFLFESIEEQEKYINALTGGKHDIDSVKIRLVKRKIIKLNSRNIDGEEMNSYIERCINSNTMFHLEELYNEYHHQNAVDLVNKVVWFRDNYFKSTSKILQIKNVLGESFKFLFGNWYEQDNDLKEPLSKFYKDIYEQVTDPHLFTPLM